MDLTHALESLVTALTILGGSLALWRSYADWKRTGKQQSRTDLEKDYSRVKIEREECETRLEKAENLIKFYKDQLVEKDVLISSLTQQLAAAQAGKALLPKPPAS